MPKASRDTSPRTFAKNILPALTTTSFFSKSPMSIFIYKNEQQEGPYDLATIQQGIASGRFAPEDLAWREGAAEWAALQTLLPIDLPPSNIPPAVPIAIKANQDQWTKAELLEVAKHQKNILWMFLISIVASFIPLATIVTGFVMVFFIYKLAKAIRSTNVWLYIVLAFFPLLNVVALVRVNGKATKILESNGIKVGLMGASLKDII